MSEPTLVPDQVRSPDIRRLHEYWNERASGRTFPAKRDIDPSELRSCLPYLTLSEIHRDPLRVRYRLVGTEVVWLRGGDVTGRWLHEIDAWGSANIAHFTDCYAEVAAGRTLVGVTDTLWVNGQERAYEWIMLPLSEDGRSVTHCLEMEDPRWGRDHRDASLRPITSK
jgi:hypothetical protein